MLKLIFKDAVSHSKPKLTVYLKICVNKNCKIRVHVKGCSTT